MGNIVGFGVGTHRKKMKVILVQVGQEGLSVVVQWKRYRKSTGKVQESESPMPGQVEG